MISLVEAWRGGAACGNGYWEDTNFDVLETPYCGTDDERLANAAEDMLEALKACEWLFRDDNEVPFEISGMVRAAIKWNKKAYAGDVCSTPEPAMRWAEKFAMELKGGKPITGVDPSADYGYPVPGWTEESDGVWTKGCRARVVYVIKYSDTFRLDTNGTLVRGPQYFDTYAEAIEAGEKYLADGTPAQRNHYVYRHGVPAPKLSIREANALIAQTLINNPPRQVLDGRKRKCGEMWDKWKRHVLKKQEYCNKYECEIPETVSSFLEDNGIKDWFRGGVE